MRLRWRLNGGKFRRAIKREDAEEFTAYNSRSGVIAGGGLQHVGHDEEQRRTKRRRRREAMEAGGVGGRKAMREVGDRRTRHGGAGVGEQGGHAVGVLCGVGVGWVRWGRWRGWEERERPGAAEVAVPGWVEGGERVRCH